MDKFYMNVALEEAQKAYQKKEVPVGAVIVCDNQIISSAHNVVESLQDATAHAEMVCIKQAVAKIGNWRLLHCTMYCTLQPCLMCAGALILSRIETLVWAAPDIRHGADTSLITNHPIHKIKIWSGVCQEESSFLLKKFFKEQRSCNTRS
jgi:tRNA(adenine34) deaminase